LIKEEGEWEEGRKGRKNGRAENKRDSHKTSISRFKS
jgi:hypothetical protein